MPIVCWKTFPSNIANMLSIKNSSMLMMSVSENFLGDIPIDVNSLPDWSLTCSYINVNSKLPNIGYVPIFMSSHCLSVQNQTNFKLLLYNTVMFLLSFIFSCGYKLFQQRVSNTKISNNSMFFLFVVGCCLKLT
jgi:hypothetical protein